MCTGCYYGQISGPFAVALTNCVCVENNEKRYVSVSKGGRVAVDWYAPVFYPKNILPVLGRLVESKVRRYVALVGQLQGSARKSISCRRYRQGKCRSKQTLSSHQFLEIFCWPEEIKIAGRRYHLNSARWRLMDHKIE